MSNKYQMTREESDFKEWKMRRSFGQSYIQEGCKNVFTCYRGIAKEVGMGLEFKGLRDAVMELTLQNPNRKNYNPKAAVTRIKEHLSKIDKLCNEVSILHREIRQLKYEYEPLNRKEQNETN